MRKILLYSSKTGNTKKIADGIADKMKPDFYGDVHDFNIEDLKEDDLLIIGGWIDKGVMNKEVMQCIEKIKDRKVAFFFTLGAYANSMHAFDCIVNIQKAFVDNHNTVLAHYHCQGAIDPKLMAWMQTLPKEHAHRPDEDRINRWNDAKCHPNQEDINAARNFVSVLLRKVEELHV